MLEIQRSRSWHIVGVATAIVPLTVGMVILSATTTPASAQSVVVGGEGFYFGVNQPTIPFIYQSPTTAPFVYGSPVLTPSPIYPSTLVPRDTYYYSPVYPSTLTPRNNYYSYPTRSGVVDSTLVNPVLVNPQIRNSTLINPVIVDDNYNYPGYRVPSVRYRHSVKVRSMN